MATHTEVTVQKWAVPAGDGMSPDVVAQVEGKSRTVLLMIPKQNWKTIDIDMSIKCTKAVIEVLTEALALAEINHEAHLKEMKEDE